jgi:putative ABC transport system ATP-binding protein
MLSITNVARVYQTDVVRTHALRGLTLQISEGDFAAVVGPSGSGKTTFLNIAGLLEPYDEGTYLLDGQDVSRLSDNDRSRLRNEKIGFIFQGFNLIPDLSVFDNVDVPLRYRGFKAAERRERINTQLERVGLLGRAKHLPAQLSGGQQQRVAIARALAGEPKFLLADEPTGNLDSETATGVLDLLKTLHAGGTTIVMVTHDAGLAGQAQSVIRLQDGHVVEAGL